MVAFQLYLIGVFVVHCSISLGLKDYNAHKPRLLRFGTHRFGESDDLDNRPRGFGKPRVVAAAKDINSTEVLSTNEKEIKVQAISEVKTPRQRMIEELDSKIMTLKEEEDLLASDPSVGAVPEIVANRMIGRIVRHHNFSEDYVSS